MFWIFIPGFIVGSVLGSLSKALADRSIRDVSYFGRSYCQSCKKTLKWYDLFPVLSYLTLRGKCRYCRKIIPWDNFLSEIILGIIIGALFVVTIPANFLTVFDNSFQTFVFLLILIFKIFAITVLTIIFIVDLKTYIIPDRIIFPSSAIASIFLIVYPLSLSVNFYQSLKDSPLGTYLLPPYSNYFLDQIIRIWMVSFWSITSGLVASLIFALLIILTRGKGMGWGDVKYVFFLGLILGFPNLAVALFLAFFLGAIFGIGLIILGKKQFGQMIPFGPFLSLGALLALFWGQEILNTYLGMSPVLGH